MEIATPAFSSGSVNAALELCRILGDEVGQAAW
jgi:hypothetical protein